MAVIGIYLEMCSRRAQNGRVKRQVQLLCFYIPLSLLCISTHAHDSDRSAAIRGVVLGPNQQPVATARVKATFTGAFDGIVPAAITDGAGHFKITGLPWGDYWVTASKEQDGYPDQSNAFYVGLNSHPVAVALDATHREQTLTVHLGRKAGVIFGTIVDAQSGEPVEPCAELRWKHQPAISWSGTGLLKSTFHLLVPADTDVTVAVWQWGYAPWFYRNQSGGDSLRLGAGHELKLQIRMLPTSNKNRKPSDEELKAMGQSVSRSGCPLPSPNRDSWR